MRGSHPFSCLFVSMFAVSLAPFPRETMEVTQWSKQAEHGKAFHVHAMQGSTSQFLRCPSSIRGKRRHRKRKCGTIRTFGSAGSIVCGGKTRFNLVSGFFYEPPGSSIRASSSSGPADDTAARHARQQSHSFFSICLLHSGIGLHSGWKPVVYRLSP